jgi:hypothetical protein
VCGFVVLLVKQNSAAGKEKPDAGKTGRGRMGIGQNFLLRRLRVITA